MKKKSKTAKQKMKQTFNKVFNEIDAKLSSKEVLQKNKTWIYLGLAIIFGALFAAVIKVLLIMALFSGIVYLFWKYKNKKKEVPITDEAIQKVKKQNEISD